MEVSFTSPVVSTTGSGAALQLEGPSKVLVNDVCLRRTDTWTKCELNVMFGEENGFRAMEHPTFLLLVAEHGAQQSGSEGDSILLYCFVCTRGHSKYLIPLLSGGQSLYHYNSLKQSTAPWLILFTLLEPFLLNVENRRTVRN